MKKQYQATVDAVTLDGFTEKEVDDRIAKEERRGERLKGKLEELRYDLKATQDAVEMWKAMLKKIRKLRKQQEGAINGKKRKVD